MSTIADRIAAAKPVQRRADVYVWMDTLNAEDHTAVMGIVTDTDWSHQAVMRFVNGESVPASKETIQKWRRSLGFNG